MTKIHIWGDLQIIEADTIKLCRGCKREINVLSLLQFKYLGKQLFESRYLDELMQCRHCKTNFIIRWNLFDKDGHILSRVFSEDPNDLNVSWMDSLSESQKKEIANHMSNCIICQNKLNESQLETAQFSALLNRLRTK